MSVHTRQEVIAILKKIISEKLDLDIPESHIKEEAGFSSEVGVDSIGFIELRFQCEEEFKIKISEEEFGPDNFFNCKTLSDFIVNKLEAH
ncbi:coronafacic acid synthetase [Pseudomonas canadensis]|uniref:Coronafacic acid synthetase n=1 Tax=Pseudomonas canadensis TaxID=915099 RepID=A0A423FGK8_9PSED|nr:phosphopantetheine-binding protein [Pseudomonas canadensis]ROM56844.1 coronafacic acid synthetase [Pseudomonas canadensis]